MALPRDEETFLQILDSCKGIIYKVAHAYGQSAVSQKDLHQEIILQLWRSFAAYDERYALTTWIYRIALNVCISSYRREHRRAGINQSLTADVIQRPAESGMTADPEQISEMYAAIQTLKELDRALVLLYLDGFSQQEMAEILGCTVTNISTRFYRVKEQLRKKLSPIQSDYR